MNLYDIKTEYLTVLNELESMEAMTPELIADTMEAMKGELTDKLAACAAYTLNLKADINAYKNHEKSIKAKREALEKRSEAMKENILNAMVAANIDKIDGGLFKVGLRKASQKLHIIEESDINACFRSTVTTIVIDKAAITTKLKEGHIVKGAELIEGKRPLVIG